MKKSLFLLFYLLITFTSISQTTAIPDTNFEQALIDLGIDPNPTINGAVPTASIDTITYLNIDSKNISNLTGIQNFLALQILYCSDNNLSNINISANVFLEKLYCSNNSLISLNTNANAALKELYLDSNKLEILNISTNTALKILFCNDNALTSLNVSTNTALIFLFCSKNKLSNLNVSTNIVLEALKCNENTLTNLDIRNGNNTNITAFEALTNPNLNCILVDNATWSTTNWTDIDAVSVFVNNETECATLNIEKNTFNSEVSLYPNPSKDLSIINLGKTYTYVNLTVVNAVGTVVNETNFSFIQHFKLDIENFTKGLYFVNIKADSKTAKLKLLVL